MEELKSRCWMLPGEKLKGFMDQFKLGTNEKIFQKYHFIDDILGDLTRL
jgi:hypothetical protein